MDYATQGLGYDILTIDDLFCRTFDKVCLNAKKRFTQKILHSRHRLLTLVTCLANQELYGSFQYLVSALTYTFDCSFDMNIRLNAYSL